MGPPRGTRAPRVGIYLTPGPHTRRFQVLRPAEEAGGHVRAALRARPPPGRHGQGQQEVLQLERPRTRLQPKSLRTHVGAIGLALEPFLDPRSTWPRTTRSSATRESVFYRGTCFLSEPFLMSEVPLHKWRENPRSTTWPGTTSSATSRDRAFYE